MLQSARSTGRFNIGLPEIEKERAVGERGRERGKGDS